MHFLYASFARSLSIMITIFTHYILSRLSPLLLIFLCTFLALQHAIRLLYRLHVCRSDTFPWIACNLSVLVSVSYCFSFVPNLVTSSFLFNGFFITMSAHNMMKAVVGKQGNIEFITDPSMIIASRAVSPCSSGLPPNPTVGPHGSISQAVPPATTAFTAVPSPSLRTRQATSLTETHAHKHMIKVQFTMQQVHVFEHNAPNLTSRTSPRNIF